MVAGQRRGGAGDNCKEEEPQAGGCRGAMMRVARGEDEEAVGRRRGRWCCRLSIAKAKGK